MLLYYAASETTELEEVERRGLRGAGTNAPGFFHDVSSALQAGSGPVFVIDVPNTMSAGPNTDEFPPVTAIPPDSIRNLRPYRRPNPVVAAGGYVGCSLPNDVAVLLIYRRGVWDLPKGKQDPGEDVQHCAVREVREEVGIDTVEVLRSLGTTDHAYPDDGQYAVKTTHWFLMQTPERSFFPDHREGIRCVQWARWDVAQRHIGYDNLRRHMDRVESEVRSAFR